jgi:hypothetical protein
MEADDSVAVRSNGASLGLPGMAGLRATTPCLVVIPPLRSTPTHDRPKLHLIGLYYPAAGVSRRDFPDAPEIVVPPE